MADGQHIEVRGLDKLEREAREIQRKLPDVIQRSTVEGAEMLADMARSLVPVQSGTLQAGIRAAENAKGAFVDDDVIYAGPIHFGWRAHHIEPQPFLYDAADQDTDRIIQQAGQNVEKLIDTTITPGTR